jgi:hypothetical protein
MPDDPPAPVKWWQEYKPLITWTVTVTVTSALAALTALVGRQTAPIPPPVVERTIERVEVPIWSDGSHPETGWVSDPDAVRAFSETLGVKVFADTPAGNLPAGELPKFVYGWKPYEQLFGRPPPTKNQLDLGSCVSFGTNTGVERTLAGEIVRRHGSKEEFSLFVEEATYGGSRVEVGGGRIRGDGSVGAWAAKFVTQWGMVPRQKYDSADLTTYSTTRGRDWGRNGVPAEFEAVAKKYPIKSTVQVKNWAEAKLALASGRWEHCMCLDGYQIDDNGNEYGHITNSWGASYHTGPVGWGDPQPDGFWAEAAVVDRMLQQGDSWTFSGVTGFPRREPLDWAGGPVRPLDFWARRVHTGILLAQTSFRRPFGGENVPSW